MLRKYTVFEICAGAGGQSLGLEQAGFQHIGAVDIDANACDTLRLNRSSWCVEQSDIRELEGRMPTGIDVFAGGVPCPPFSIAGKQLGKDDERDLFPVALRLIKESQPKAVLLENVPGLASRMFSEYRNQIIKQLGKMEYVVFEKILYSSDFGVPQRRPRYVLVGLKPSHATYFRWVQPAGTIMTVAEAIGDLMLSRGWEGGQRWLAKAQHIGPTLVGGSKKHGGPDLGPTRSKQQWAALGINAVSLGEHPPEQNFPADGLPKLTLDMVARLQAFPPDWIFVGNKTAKYRQIGNAFPPPVAKAIGQSIHNALSGVTTRDEHLPIGKTLDMFSSIHT